MHRRAVLYALLLTGACPALTADTTDRIRAARLAVQDETVTATLDHDGTWRVAGHFIQ